MKYHTHYRKFYFFVYRVPSGGALDIRTPCGGVTAYGHDELSALDIAFTRSYERFACRPSETLAVVRTTDKEGRRQVCLLERSKQRDDAKFMELMEVEV